MANQIQIVSNIDGNIETLKATRIHFSHEDLFNDVASQKGWELLDTYEPESTPRGNAKARVEMSSRQRDIRERNNFRILNVFTGNNIKEISYISVDGEPLVINDGSIIKCL